MKLNMDYYKKDLEYISDKDKKIIENCEKELDKSSLEYLQIFSKIRENIVNWYPFKEGAQILEINSNFGEVTGYLCDKAKKVIAIENSINKAKFISKRYKNNKNLEIIPGKLEDIKIDEKFDYIISIGITSEQLESFLDFSKSHLQEDGIILFATDNIIGLNNLNGLQTLNNPKIAKNKIEKILNKNNFNKFKFYYPLPNYKMPNVIFTDEYLPNTESILRDLTLYDQDDIISFEEREVYKNILREDQNLFKCLANSFLVEVSNNNQINTSVKFISFGNSRKPEYRLKTVMLEDIIYKENIDDNSKNHLNQIEKNIQILEKSDINILDSFKEAKVYSKLIKDKTFDKQLIEIYEKYGIDKLIEKIEIFKQEIENKMEKCDKNFISVFNKYNIECHDLEEKLTFIKYGIFDLIFQNCFEIEDKLYFYDQEWIEENVPVEFIIYRAIFYLGNSKREIDTMYIYKKLGIIDYIDIFKQLEDLLQAKIKDTIVWSIHVNNNKTVKNLYDTNVHLRNINAIEANKYEEEIKNIKEINNKIEKENEKLRNQLNYMQNSKSWKITKVFRKFVAKLNK